MVTSFHYKLLRFLINPKYIGVCAIALLLQNNTHAQNMIGSLTVNSSPQINFLAASDYENGVSINDQTLTINMNAAMNWTLKVRAISDFENTSSSSISANLFTLKVINMPNAFPPITLTQENQDLVTGTSVSAMETYPITINYSCNGGNAFLIGEGIYETQLIFTLTMVNP